MSDLFLNGLFMLLKKVVQGKWVSGRTGPARKETGALEVGSLETNDDRNLLMTSSKAP